VALTLRRTLLHAVIHSELLLRLLVYCLGAVIAQSVWRWATGWTIGVLGFDSRRGLGIFFSTTASRTALGPTQSPIQWVRDALSLGVKRPGSEADHSPQPSGEFKECVKLYLHFPTTPSWHGAQFSSVRYIANRIRGCIQKFPDWLPGARTANGTALCHYVQFYRYFVSQSSEFCRHYPLNECLLLLFISLSIQSGNFWIHPPMLSVRIFTIYLL
jgi:hypothetical protein